MNSHHALKLKHAAIIMMRLSKLYAWLSFNSRISRFKVGNSITLSILCSVQSNLTWSVTLLARWECQKCSMDSTIYTSQILKKMSCWSSVLSQHWVFLPSQLRRSTWRTSLIRREQSKLFLKALINRWTCPLNLKALLQRKNWTWLTLFRSRSRLSRLISGSKRIWARLRILSR